MKAQLSYVLIFIFIYACNEHVDNTVTSQQDSSVAIIYAFPPDKDRKILDSLATRAISHGDTIAYKELSRLFIMVRMRKNDLFYYAYRMAINHNYAQAYWDLFFVLSGPTHTGENYKDTDECTRKIAMYYLLMAYEKGDRNAGYTVLNYFEKNKIPSSSSYRSKFCF